MTVATAPLRLPAFGRLAASYAINELGDWLGAVALAILVFDETRDPLATTALFVAAKFVPAALAPALTAKLDQLATRRALPAIYALEALGFGALALLATSFFLPAVLALALLDGTLALTGRALSRAAAAAVLEPAGALREGNALLNIAFAIAFAAGPALAGVVVAGLGVAAALALDGASFLVIAVLLGTARGLPDAHPEREPWRERMRAGMAYVRGHRIVRALLGGEAAALVFFTAITPIEVVYAKESLGTGDAGFGLLLAAWGAGVVLGSIVFARARRRSPTVLILVSTAAVGASYLGIAAAATLLVACLVSVVGGVGNGIQWVAVVTALQEAIAPEFQARVIGLLESLGAAMPGIGFVLGGVVTAVLSPRAAYAVAGAGVLLLVLVALTVLRTLAQRDAAPDANPA